MKLLFEENLSYRLLRLVADVFPNSDQVNALGLGRADDRSIWDYAKTHDFVLVTQDSDFADLAALLHSPPKVVWLPCGNLPTAAIAALIRDCSQQIASLVNDPDLDCLEIF